MRLLIAILTCHQFRARADILRRTWIPDALGTGIDVKFFLGRGVGLPAADEIWLDCPDDYPSLRLKTQLAFRWTVDHDYDFVLKMDDDVYVIPSRLSGCFGKDYSGRVRGPSATSTISYENKRLLSGHDLYGAMETSFASGFGYCLSKRAAQYVAEAPDNGDWAEDRFAGNALAKVGIRPDFDHRFLLWPPLTGHFCHMPNGRCLLCAQQYGQAAVICPYAKPQVIETLHEHYKTTGFIPTWIP